MIHLVQGSQAGPGPGAVCGLCGVREKNYSFKSGNIDITQAPQGFYTELASGNEKECSENFILMIKLYYLIATVIFNISANKQERMDCLWSDLFNSRLQQLLTSLRSLLHGSCREGLFLLLI